MAMLVNPFIDTWVGGTDKLNKQANSVRREVIPEAQNLVSFRLSWNFNYGRQYKSGNKKMNNTDDNSGVLDGGR